jgi:hypothetical protein
MVVVVVAIVRMSKQGERKEIFKLCAEMRWRPAVVDKPKLRFDDNKMLIPIDDAVDYCYIICMYAYTTTRKEINKTESRRTHTHTHTHSSATYDGVSTEHSGTHRTSQKRKQKESLF